MNIALEMGKFDYFQLKCLNNNTACSHISSSYSKQIQFNDVHDFLQHYTETHGMKGYVACCAMKLMKIHAMAMHMARHIQPEAFKCPECSEILTCPKILQYHIQNHLPEARRPLSCKECPRRFSYASALAAHTLIHQPEHERVAHICDECGKV